MEGCRGPHLAAVGARLRAETEVADGSARSLDNVAVGPVDRRVFVQIVGVVRADADPSRSAAIGDCTEPWGLGIGALDEVLKAGACKARKVPVPLRLIEGVAGCPRSNQGSTCSLERVTELIPRFTTDDALLAGAERRATQSADEATEAERKEAVPAQEEAQEGAHGT
jgi:hypothetical protein